jgi:circadian clock protein KaiC
VLTSPAVLDQELRSPDSVLMKTALEMGARRIFIDSIALLRPANGNGHSLTGSGSGSYRDLLQQLGESLRREKLTALLAHEVGTRSEAAATLEVAEMLTDTVIRLERGHSERGIYRTIEILKSRGQDFDAGEHTLRIVGGKGLEVFPRIQSDIRSRSPQPSSVVRRSAIGVKALDDLTGGGLYEGSVTLVTGVAGSGKSILGYQVCVEGATKLGKRSLLVTADEHPEQVLRNADLLGLNLREQVNAGMVHIFSASPFELEVDVHYKLICQKIEQNDIDRLVVDGLTAIRNALNDDRRFREFMHGIMAFTKERLMTTLLCYEHPELFGMSRFMPEAGISSIVDNIILLNLVELGDRLHRAITVVKSRGSKHVLTTHEYTIGSGGIGLVPARDGAFGRGSFGDYFNLLSRAPTRFSRGQRSETTDRESEGPEGGPGGR